MKKALILLSGGLDSATCLAFAKDAGFECHALSFDYGQKHFSELEAAKVVAAHFNVSHKIIRLPIDELQGSSLTEPAIAISDYQENGEIPNTYVPARNTILLAFALGYAEVLKSQAIFIGVSAIDYSNYPDCRPEYIEAFQKLASLATKVGVEGNTIKIHTPLIHLSKAQTILLGAQLGVDYQMTVSCYRADKNGYACGTCDSCVLRKKGFKEAGVQDVTRYVA